MIFYFRKNTCIFSPAERSSSMKVWRMNKFPLPSSLHTPARKIILKHCFSYFTSRLQSPKGLASPRTNAYHFLALSPAHIAPFDKTPTFSYLQTLEGGSYQGLYRKCSYLASAYWLQMCPCSTLAASRKLYHKLPARKWVFPTCKWSLAPTLQATLEVVVPLILP